MSETSKQRRRSFSDEFKRDAVDLVVKQGYSFKAAAEAVGVTTRLLRDWHEKIAPDPDPCGQDASLAQLRDDNMQVRKKLQRAEMEREILKKATAYFAKESQ
jgi:transposase